MPYPLLDFGGSGPVLHWFPANGFPLETYAPIFERLAARCRVVSIPPRALWPGLGPPPAAPGSWESLADDVLAGLREHHLDGVILAGHSFGGIVSLIAAARDRVRIRALALLDPTIPPAAEMERFRAARESGWRDGNPLATRARERKAVFESHDQAFAYWRERRLFADWPDPALQRYVRGMLGPDRSEGPPLALRWSPAWEAWYYESFYTESWDDVARLDPALPILIIGGGTSDTFVPEAARRFQALAPWAEIGTIPGHGHLFPQSDPDGTATLLERWLDRAAVAHAAGSPGSSR